MSAAAFPPGGTFFDTVKRGFQDVPVDESKDDAISTAEYLEAVEIVTKLFDVLGSAAFSPVKSDMATNAKKVKERQLAAPLDSETLQDLVRNELKSGKHTATEGLLWLNRGLDFTQQAMRNYLQNPSEELSTSFRNAYGPTLKPHHSFLVKPIFSAAMSALPYRRDFEKKMADDQVRVKKELGEWLDGLERLVKILNKFMVSKEAQWK